MPVRLPIFASGDITYSGGNPVYDGGTDLAAVAVMDNSYGDNEVAASYLDGDKAAITGDSQWDTGTSRAINAVVKTHEFYYTTMFVPPATSSPMWTAAYGQDTFQGSQWTLDTSTSTSGKTVAQIHIDEGIGDPTQIPMRFGWTKRTVEGVHLIMQTADSLNLADAPRWFDSDNFNPPGGAKIKFSMALLTGGNSDSPDNMRFRQEVINAIGGQDTSYKYFPSIAAISGSAKTTLSLANNSASLVMIESDILDSYPSNDSIRPRAGFWRDTELFLNKSVYHVGGLIEEYESDGTTPKDGAAICLIRSAASMNMATFIHGATLNGLPDRDTHGGDRGTRSWMWDNFKDPNLLIYSFGHNSAIRSGTGFKAASTFQADLFDGIYQDCNDYFDANGSWPQVMLIAPWAGGSMNDARHSQMMGVVDGLRGHGIKTLGVSLYNYWGGSAFDGSTAPSNPTDWTDVANTTFQTDSGGTGVHPNSQNDARIAWYAMKTILEEAMVAAQQGGGRSRGRSRDRSAAVMQ